MKLLSIVLARSIWLGGLNELNPRGISFYSAIPLIMEYNFRSYPTSQEQYDLSKGIKFNDGEYKTKDGELISIALTIYNDGFTVDTRSSTRDADAFMNDLLTKLCESLNFPNFEQIIRERLYLSQMHISTDADLGLLNKKLKGISKYLSQYFSIPYEIGGISFWPDQTSKNPRPQFTLERAANAPFSEKKYFSSAGLHTDEHWELLNELESLFMA